MATLNLQHIDKIYDNNVQAVFDFNLDVKDRSGRSLRLWKVHDPSYGGRP